MAYYYNPPKKNTIKKQQILRIQEENQLKFACQEDRFTQIRLLSMKNCKVNDQSTVCLSFIQTQLKIETIDLSENFSFITDRTIQNFCSCKGLINLKTLNLADNQISDLGIEMLCNHINFQKIKTLILYGNTNLTFICLLSMAKSEWMKGIQKLDLHATSIADNGIAQYLKQKNSQMLQDLDISMNWKRVTDITLKALSNSIYCKNIKKLNLEDCSISDIGIQLICNSHNLQKLQDLNVSNSISKSTNRITDKSLECLAFAKNITNLKVLYLKCTDVTSAGVKYLTCSHIIEKLQVLKLSHCRLVDNHVLYHIGSMIEYSNLVKLHVNATGVEKTQGAQFQQKYPKIMIIY